MSTNLAYMPEENLWPDSDGKPMADNTEQYEWIVKIKENLEILFAARADVFIAGDLLWYPLPDRTPPAAPDVLVAFGRPKGRRGSYKQWEENDIAPQVVFEIPSPGNSKKEMDKKFEFYRRYGVEEYYLYDPDKNALTGWQRHGHWLKKLESMQGWRSPRLGIRFEPGEETLALYYPDGRRFLSPVELDARARQAEAEAVQAKAAAEQARIRAEQAEAERDAKDQKIMQMTEYLRKLGIDWKDVQP